MSHQLLSKGQPDMILRHMDNHTATESVSIEIVQRVATATGRDESELPPLYESVNPEALDSLVDSLSAPSVSITFTYLDFTVTVTGTGTVQLESDSK